MAFIFGLSSIAHPPSLPEGADKNFHALLYSGLAVLVARALAGGWRRRVTLAAALATIAIATTYGVTDEWHQSFVPPRSSDAFDVVADGIGATAAAFAVYAWGIIRRYP